MSIEELHAELEKLAPADLARVEALVREIKTAPAAPTTTMAKFMGCAQGMVTFMPGWDEDEPLEMWEALRDDTPL